MKIPWQASSPPSFPWPALHVLLFAPLLALLAGLHPIVRFTEEQIDIHVHPDHVHVEGHYVYKNPFPFPVVQGFSIPLPVDATHPMPVQVSVHQRAPGDRSIPVRFFLGRHRFDLAFSANEEIGLEVRYRQHAPERSARYILTTTEPWRRPLESARYRVLPRGVQIRSSNYELQPIEPHVLAFHRRGFRPQKDWELSWEASQQ